MPHVAVTSPCIRVCTLDDDQVCIGCGRTVPEIMAWTRLSATDRQLVRERAERRRVARDSDGAEQAC